ncbi:hypothetical protein CFOL_v3_09932 [Cephalotus follicularis]|uniref:Uncharacterized protein n=1 Tax=Cephalotus follicularis TaxID=3775 RepID=A0A1Q3BF10_CEPFO|nr:hypothetical protein CFOL_v3_09932 [Cephalotus follicularis]
MSWPNLIVVEGNGRERCKIRKRGCSSPSSSSLIQKKYRFKSAIIVGKRGGSSTPNSTWKSTRSPSVIQAVELSKSSPSQGGFKAKKTCVSARKLGATLWEINKHPSLPVKKDMELVGDTTELRSGKVSRLSHCGSLHPHLSDPSSNHILERMEKERGGSHGRRRAVVTDHYLGMLDSVRNGSSVSEIETRSHGKSQNGCIIGVKARLKDVSYHLTTSKELLKLLIRICGPEEQHAPSIEIVSAIRVELDRARNQVEQLIRDPQYNHSEIDYIMKYFAEEKAAWKSKARDSIRTAIASIAEELEFEKKRRRQTERLNKKIGKELADTKASLSKAWKELESEKSTKEIMEQVCYELATGIGEDRAEVEELKRESTKVREDVEKERQMLHLADVLREEGVQMKLAEAKYHFEEKTAAVENLRNELEAYLRTKKGLENGNGSPNMDRIKELEAYLKEINFGSCQNAEGKEDDVEVSDNEEYEGDDSADSDLHSIELNIENTSRSYSWNYACGVDAQDDSKKVSVDKGIKQRGTISFERGTCNGLGWDSGAKSWEILDGFDRERPSELVSQEHMQEYEDKIKRCKSVMSLRDGKLSGSKLAMVHNFPSSIQQWGELGCRAQESSPVLQGNGLKPKLSRPRGEHQIVTRSRQY